MKSFKYDGPNIRNYCLRHLRRESGDYLYRIFYYDTPPLGDRGHNPLTQNNIDFKKTVVYRAQTELLRSIKSTPNFALRLGETVWRNPIRPSLAEHVDLITTKLPKSK